MPVIQLCVGPEAILSTARRDAAQRGLSDEFGASAIGDAVAARRNNLSLRLVQNIGQANDRTP